MGTCDMCGGRGWLVRPVDLFDPPGAKLTELGTHPLTALIDVEACDTCEMYNDDSVARDAVLAALEVLK